MRIRDRPMMCPGSGADWAVGTPPSVTGGGRWLLVYSAERGQINSKSFINLLPKHLGRQNRFEALAIVEVLTVDTTQLWSISTYGVQLSSPGFIRLLNSSTAWSRSEPDHRRRKWHLWDPGQRRREAGGQELHDGASHLPAGNLSFLIQTDHTQTTPANFLPYTCGPTYRGAQLYRSSGGSLRGLRYLGAPPQAQSDSDKKWPTEQAHHTVK